MRGSRRELISRSYNRLLHATLRTRFSDAQCGFKAVRRDVLDGLLDDVRDDGWFFDTELLVLAQRRGLRIHEVPVDWVDDPDSRVDVVRTAIDDLKGVARLARPRRGSRASCASASRRTLAYALLFLALRGAARRRRRERARARAHRGRQHRREPPVHVRAARPRAGSLRQHALGAVVFVLTLALTTGALAVLHGIDATPGARRRARRPGRRRHRGDDHALRRAAQLGVRPATLSGNSQLSVDNGWGWPTPHRILVVDDEPNILDVLSMALRFQGFEVETAATGEQALAAAASFKPQLMVLDIMLPDMEGFEVARRLGARARRSRSSSSPPATRPRTRSAGSRSAATTTSPSRSASRS